MSKTTKQRLRRATKYRSVERCVFAKKITNARQYPLENTISSH